MIALSTILPRLRGGWGAQRAGGGQSPFGRLPPSTSFAGPPPRSGEDLAQAHHAETSGRWRSSALVSCRPPPMSWTLA